MMTMMMMMVMMMMNSFCGMVDRGKAFSLISSSDHCQIYSLSRISDTPRAGFEPAHKLNSVFFEWSCAVVITTASQWEILVLEFQMFCLKALVECWHVTIIAVYHFALQKSSQVSRSFSIFTKLYGSSYECFA